MELETVRQQVAVNNVASPVGVEAVAERRGAYRGEQVRSVGQNSKIAVAGKQMGVQTALKTDVATLMRRSVRQGQGTHSQATARIAEWRDKLPQMPEAESLNNLVGLMQQFSEELPAMLAHAGPLHHRVAEQASEDGARRSEREDELEESGDQAESMSGGPAGMTRAPTTIGGSGEGGGFHRGQDDQSGATEDALNRIFAALEGVDADPTHQYAALDVIRTEFEARGADPRFLSLLSAAARRFEAGDLGREVRAGMASAQIAAEAEATLQTNPAAVRETYREMLRGPKNLGQLFDALSSYDLSKSFESVVDMFVKAAGTDMESTGPSTDPAFLGHLLTELGRLKKMQTTFDNCKGVIERTERILPARERGLASATEITGALLKFASAAVVGPRDARRLLGGMAKAGSEGQVVFANGLRAVHGDIPDEIMPSPQARQQQTTALQSLQDELVAKEQQDFAERAQRTA